MFKEAYIKLIPQEERKLPNKEAWLVMVDNKDSVEIQDLATVYAYLCGYPWPSRKE